MSKFVRNRVVQVVGLVLVAIGSGAGGAFTITELADRNHDAVVVSSTDIEWIKNALWEQKQELVWLRNRVVELIKVQSRGGPNADAAILE